MIRKAVIVGSAVGATCAAFLWAATLVPLGDRGWSTTVSLTRRVFLDVHDGVIDVRWDSVRPGQAPDPTFGTQVAAAFDKARRAGTLEERPDEDPSDHILQRGGFGVRWGSGEYADMQGVRFDRAVVRVSLAVPFVVFAGFPVLALTIRSVSRWRRRRGGRCPTCGYNLTGNESGVCPECGTEIEQP